MSTERPLPSPSAAYDAADGGGRPLRRAGPARRWLAPGLAILALVIALATVRLADGRRTAPAPPTASVPGAASVVAASPTPTPNSQRSIAQQVASNRPAAQSAVNASTASGVPLAPPGVSPDPNDLATYYRPGDPVPTMTELIDALRESGIDTGIAAFNPPGTKPLLQGIVVPPDFPLPPGYVRHHQVTDEGVDVPAILMFAPDAVLYDRSGQPIALPEDRVVPPELAPPGLPIVAVELPKP